MRETVVAVIPIRGSDEEFQDGPLSLLGGRLSLGLNRFKTAAADQARNAIVIPGPRDLAAVCERTAQGRGGPALDRLRS